MKKKLGIALPMALLCMFFVSAFGFAILSVSVHGLRMTKRTRNSAVAFNVAESGAVRCMRWLKDQAAPAAGTTALKPFGSNVAMAGGKYTVTLVPDTGNAGATLKKYKIQSVGEFLGTRQTVELVVRQSSFGKYAYFTNGEISSVSGGPIWFFAGDRIRGPAHSNNSSGSDFQIDWRNSTSSIFEGSVTAVSNDIDYTPTDPANEAEYTKVFKGGSHGFKLGVDYIPLPNSTSTQKVAAWGSETGFPSTTGVYTPATGGIYIHGDAAVTMQLDVSNNQQFVVTQGSKVTTVTIDLVRNQTVVTSGKTKTTLGGTGTGVLYCSGNITSLSGTLADNLGSTKAIIKRSTYTIATDTSAGKNITITDSIKQKTAYNPNLKPDDPSNMKSGTLGIIGRNVIVSAGAPTSLEIDAVIMAGSETSSDGSFYVADWNSKKPTGSLKVLGGIIQKSRGPVGTISNGSLSTGYKKDYWYDNRMADTPPPFFPTTGGYDRVSWQRKN